MQDAGPAIGAPGGPKPRRIDEVRDDLWQPGELQHLL
jgi:hypothetical protein